MAIFHLSAQVISRSDGRSAVAAAAYRAGSSLHDPRLDRVFDFTHKSGIDHSEISLPEHAPEWMADRAKLWASVELGEKRKDSQVAREFNIALPKELPRDEKIALARRWVQELVDLGMVVDWNAHHLNGDNPHFHAMAAMRRVEGGTWSRTKARDWNAPELIQTWRESWARLSNEALAKWAKEASSRPQELPRITHLSHEARGLQEKPQQRVKASTWSMAKKGVAWAVNAVWKATHPNPPKPPEGPNEPPRPKPIPTVLPFLQDLFRSCAPSHPAFVPTPAGALALGSRGAGAGARPRLVPGPLREPGGPATRVEREGSLPGALDGGREGLPLGRVPEPGLAEKPAAVSRSR